MVRRKKKRSRRSKKIALPAAAGMAAGIVHAGLGANGNLLQFGFNLVKNYTGLDIASGQWNPSDMLVGTGALLIGGAVSMLVAKTGMNRYANVPFVKG